MASKKVKKEEPKVDEAEKLRKELLDLLKELDGLKTLNGVHAKKILVKLLKKSLGA